jgi:hypothetical protein
MSSHLLISSDIIIVPKTMMACQGKNERLRASSEDQDNAVAFNAQGGCLGARKSLFSPPWFA